MITIIIIMENSGLFWFLSTYKVLSLVEIIKREKTGCGFAVK